MKITYLKLFLSLAIIVGIANIDSIAATNIASINTGAEIPAIGINVSQKRIITNKIESNLIDRCVAIDDIDIQASLPIIL